MFDALEMKILYRVAARLLLALSVIWLCSGCSLRPPLQEQRIGQLGHFEFQEPDDRMKGVIIGAPHGSAEPASGEYAKWISEKTGAGFAIAYGLRRQTVNGGAALGVFQIQSGSVSRPGTQGKHLPMAPSTSTRLKWLSKSANKPV
jgi:hypothetical protein